MMKSNPSRRPAPMSKWSLQELRDTLEHNVVEERKRQARSRITAACAAGLGALFIVHLALQLS